MLGVQPRGPASAAILTKQHDVDAPLAPDTGRWSLAKQHQHLILCHPRAMGKRDVTANLFRRHAYLRRFNSARNVLVVCKTALQGFAAAHCWHGNPKSASTLYHLLVCVLYQLLMPQGKLTCCADCAWSALCQLGSASGSVQWAQFRGLRQSSSFIGLPN